MRFVSSLICAWISLTVICLVTCFLHRSASLLRDAEIRLRADPRARDAARAGIDGCARRSRRHQARRWRRSRSALGCLRPRFALAPEGRRDVAAERQRYFRYQRARHLPTRRLRRRGAGVEPNRAAALMLRPSVLVRIGQVAGMRLAVAKMRRAIGFAAIRVPSFAARRIVGDVEPRTARILDGALAIAPRGPRVRKPRPADAGYICAATDLGPLERDGHQCWHVAPQIERAKIPASPPHPFLRAAHVLNDQWNMPTSGFAGLALNAEANLEQCVVRRRERLGALPRHRPVAVGLTRRTRHDQRGILELRSVQRGHILNNKLRRIAVLAVLVPFDVEADHVVAFGEQT